MPQKPKSVPFKTDSINQLPNNKPVVYKLENQGGDTVYAGIAKRGRVQDRLKEHLPSGKDPIPFVKKVKIQQVSSIQEAQKREQGIISRSKPKYNKRGK